MWKKIMFHWVLPIITFFAVFLGTYAITSLNFRKDFATPLADVKEAIKEVIKNQSEPDKPDSKYSKANIFNILLLGIDRRHKSERAYRTDIMILVSVNQETKKIVMTSVPRDLWVQGGRINALMTGGGWPVLKAAFTEISGMEPDAYIQCDFEDLVWLVDSLGGVEVELDNGFTDTEYPNDVTKTYITVSFEAGKQTVTGKEALIFSRSRHGNNGEGSDFKRMQRQHKILKALPNAVLSPKSIFNPFTIEKFYEAVTQRMYTDVSLDDARTLWDFYTDKDKYQIESFYVNSDYLYNPPMREYGGAWVLVARNNSYAPVHQALKERLGLIEPIKPVETSTDTSNTQP